MTTVAERNPKFLPNFPPKPSEEDRQQPKTTVKSLVTDFTTKPIPLPIWLWNPIVIGIYFWVGYLLISFAVILLVGIVSLFT